MTAAPLRLAKRIRGGAPDLRHGSRRRIDRLSPHGLNGIDNEHARDHALRHRRYDILNRSFRCDLDRRLAKAEPFRAQPHLGHRLFARNVDGAVPPARECRRDFEQQSGFADPRIAAKQKHRTAHEPAAGDAIEFGDTGGKPWRLRGRAL
jgi:hypothetical protein